MTAKILAQYGHFKVAEQHRQKYSGQKEGIRPKWIEYQVREGRRVLSRHELFTSAISDAERRNKELWKEITEQ